MGDELYGGAGADNLYGYMAGDYLEGGSGNDCLGGFYGNDTLSGGQGKDWFFFETKPNSKKNFDKILDFGSGDDLIRLDNDVFHGVGKAGHTLHRRSSRSAARRPAPRPAFSTTRTRASFTTHPTEDGGKQTNS